MCIESEICVLLDFNLFMHFSPIEVEDDVGCRIWKEHRGTRFDTWQTAYSDGIIPVKLNESWCGCTIARNTHIDGELEDGFMKCIVSLVITHPRWSDSFMWLFGKKFEVINSLMWWTEIHRNHEGDTGALVACSLPYWECNISWWHCFRSPTRIVDWKSEWHMRA